MYSQIIVDGGAFSLKLKLMKQLILNVKEDKFRFFMELIKNFDFVQVEDDREKALKELKNSLNQVKLMRDGKLTKQSAEEFLDEL